MARSAQSPAPAHNGRARADRARRTHGMRQARAAERRARIVELLRERRSESPAYVARPVGSQVGDR
jgi:hypothetical protein